MLKRRVFMRSSFEISSSSGFSSPFAFRALREYVEGTLSPCGLGFFFWLLNHLFSFLIILVHLAFRGQRGREVDTFFVHQIKKGGTWPLSYCTLVFLNVSADF